MNVTIKEGSPKWIVVITASSGEMAGAVRVRELIDSIRYNVSINLIEENTMLINGETHHIGTPEWEAAVDGQ